MKSVQIWSFFWSVFSRIRTQYGNLWSKSAYSIRIRENTNQKNSVFGHFSRSVDVLNPYKYKFSKKGKAYGSFYNIFL